MADVAGAALTTDPGHGFYSAAYATLGGASAAIGARSNTRSQANVIAAEAILGTYDAGTLTGAHDWARLVPASAARRYASQKSAVVCGSRFVMVVSLVVTRDRSSLTSNASHDERIKPVRRM